MEQHLGNYHQSVPALSGDVLFRFQLREKDSTQLETLGFTVNFIHIFHSH